MEGELKMNTDVLIEQEKITHEEMVRLLNEDLAREYQAVIAAAAPAPRRISGHSRKAQ
jgi:hypothetical protein